MFVKFEDEIEILDALMTAEELALIISMANMESIVLFIVMLFEKMSANWSPFLTLKLINLIGAIFLHID